MHAVGVHTGYRYWGGTGPRRARQMAPNPKLRTVLHYLQP